MPTPHGVVGVRWARASDAFRVAVEVPDGCTARVSLPGAARASARVLLDGKPVGVAHEGQRRVLDVQTGSHEVAAGL